MGKQNIQAKEVYYFILPVVPFLEEVQSITDPYKVLFRRGDCRNRGVGGILVSKLPRAVDPGSKSGRRIEIYFLYFLLTPCQGNIVINTCEGESETERQTT